MPPSYSSLPQRRRWEKNRKNEDPTLDSPGSPDSELANQSLKTNIPDLNTLDQASRFLIDIGRNNPVFPLRILPTEREKVLRIELSRRPFALDGIWSAAVPPDDKVDLVLILVSPVVHLLRLQRRLDLIQYEVLPQET